MTSAYSRAGLLGHFSVVMFLLATETVATAQARRDPTPEPASRTRMLFSADYCATRCHAHPELYTEDLVICRMNESTIWAHSDKHRKAYAVLFGALGNQIRSGLRIKDDRTKKDDISSCVRCHSMPEGPQPAQIPGLAARPKAIDPMAEGVSCVTCHGPYEEWVYNHQQLTNVAWRGKSRETKESKYGMTDLWNPVTRTKLCVSCHIGDAEDHKVVTHAMYAAGHPPLPGVEIATFSDAMPRHWEYLGEKKGKKQGAVLEALRTHHGDGDLDRLERTELVAVSGLVVQIASLRMFVSEAKQQKEMKDVPGSRWPDFARFDCYACHHDVNRPSWRQERRFAGVPGRPPAPSWSTAIVDVGIQAANPKLADARIAKLSRELRDFHKALSVQPFGDKDRAVNVATALADWTDVVLCELSCRNIRKEEVRGLLVRICESAKNDLPDYDTARQLFWAYRAIYKDYAERNQREPAVEGVLKELDRALGFSLRSARTSEEIEKTLSARLNTLTSYDPVKFQEYFRRLECLLPAP